MTELSQNHKEQLYDLLWERGLAGIAIVTKEGKFIKANPAFCKIVEYNETELRSMMFKDITLPSDVDADTTMFEKILKNQTDEYDMFKGYITKMNSIVYVHLRVFPFKRDGEIYYVIGQVYPLAPDMVTPAAPVTVVNNDINTFKLDWKKIVASMTVAVTVIGAFFVGIGHVIGILNA